MVTIFIIPKSNIRFIGIYFLTTSPVTAINVTLISRIHIAYLSHAFRYCSIFLNTNISPLIPSPRKVRIAIILKNHDHSVEKYSRSPKIFNSDGQMQTATFCGQQGRISRTVRAILNGQPGISAGQRVLRPTDQY